MTTIPLTDQSIISSPSSRAFLAGCRTDRRSTLKATFGTAESAVLHRARSAGWCHRERDRVSWTQTYKLHVWRTKFRCSLCYVCCVRDCGRSASRWPIRPGSGCCWRSRKPVRRRLVICSSADLSSSFAFLLRSRERDSRLIRPRASIN
jgi:hypothetical protein